MSVQDLALEGHPTIRPSLDEMVWIPGGTFRMGSDHHYAEEAPSHRVTVDGFFIDRTPVTNREFRRFVDATGYVTSAEIPLCAADYPGALPHMLRAGSMVFVAPKHDASLHDYFSWWQFKFGAHWRRPAGKGSWIHALPDHPVVHITYCDAQAYAAWAGKELPTEAEWDLPRAAGSTAPSSHGETSSCPAAGTWRTPGRASFPARTTPPTDLSAPRP